MTDAPANVLDGVAISEGVAVGPVLFLHNEILSVPRISISAGRVDEEVERFRTALREAEQDYREQADRFSESFSGSEKRIFETQLQFFQDESLRQSVVERIRDQKLNAEAAIKDALDHYARLLGELDSVFRERQADVRDVGTRIQRVLLRREQAPMVEGSEPFVLYARELLPSDTMSIDRERLVGLVTERRWRDQSRRDPRARVRHSGSVRDSGSDGTRSARHHTGGRREPRARSTWLRPRSSWRPSSRRGKLSELCVSSGRRSPPRGHGRSEPRASRSS